MSSLRRSHRSRRWYKRGLIVTSCFDEQQKRDVRRFFDLICRCQIEVREFANRVFRFKGHRK